MLSTPMADERTVTGAGMSVESGFKTFRGNAEGCVEGQGHDRKVLAELW